MNDLQSSRTAAVEWGARLCTLALALWLTGMLWFQLTRQGGAGLTEYVYLGTLTPLSWLALALYALRFRWSYLTALVPPLGLVAGFVKAAVDGPLYFSLSAGNLLTVAILLLALTGILLNWRAFWQSNVRPWRSGALATAAMVVVAAGVASLLSANSETITRLDAQYKMARLKRRLSGMETLEEKVSCLVDEGDLPSAVAGIVVDDSLVWAKAFGDGVDLNSTYNVGSVAKPVVATAVLQLHEQGQINLDADINEYLPFTVNHPNYPKTPITPRLLLSHQSGVAHYSSAYLAYEKSSELIEWDMGNRGTTIYGPAEPMPDKPDYGDFLREYLSPGGAYYTQEVWTTNQPGSVYAYSSVGFDLLGYLVEIVSGQPFDDYLQNHVFGPLGMTRSGRLGSDQSGNTAQPYERVYSAVWRTDLTVPYSGHQRIGGGGLTTTVPDLAQFLIAHMNGGQNGPTRVLQAGSIERMHQPAIFTSGDIGMVASGYGWSHRAQKPWEYWGTKFEMRGAQGHGGADYGSRASMYFVDETDGAYGVILLTNISDFYEQDMPWYFATYMQLEGLLMDEAQAMWQSKHG